MARFVIDAAQRQELLETKLLKTREYDPEVDNIGDCRTWQEVVQQHKEDIHRIRMIDLNVEYKFLDDIKTEDEFLVWLKAQAKTCPITAFWEERVL